MGPFTTALVYLTCWWLILLPILSAGNTSQADADDIVPGTERGAPISPKFRLKLIIATLGAAVITTFIWVGQQFGWFDALARFVAAV